MIYCSKCGSGNQDDAKFCYKCGAAIVPAVINVPDNSGMPGTTVQDVPAAGGYPQQPTAPPTPYVQTQSTQSGVRLDRKEFLNHPANEKIHKQIKSDAIVLYVLLGLGLVANLIYLSPLAAVNILLLIFIAVAHLKLNKIFAILAPVMVIVGAVIIGASLGTVVNLIVTVFFAVHMCKFDKIYKAYQNTGNLA